MSIKEILQKINIQADEQEIHDFLKHSEAGINEFFKEKWNMFKREQLFAMQVKSKQIQLLIGKKDRNYELLFHLDSIGIPEIESFVFENLPEGISYSAAESMISGVPAQTGDHKVILRCFSKHGYQAEKELTLTILPDPKELWKNIPTPNDVKYFKPDSALAFLKVETKNGAARKDVVAASRRGRSHALEGKPRDDDFMLHFEQETEWYVMAVADGAGSAKYSRRGSEIACRTAKEVCAKQLAKVEKDGISDVLDLAIQEYHKNNSEQSRSDLYRALHSEVLAKAAWEAYSNIGKEASQEQCKPKDFATTLILSICKKFDFGWFVGTFWVGDGGMGIYHKEKQELKILGEPDGGEFAGQTRFLTMPEVFSDRVRVRFEIVEDFTAIVLMTDGVTDPKFETDANLNRIEKWNELWDDLNGNNEDGLKVDFTDDNEASAEQLLKWLDFWSRGNHDDRTIAILF